MEPVIEPAVSQRLVATPSAKRDRWLPLVIVGSLALHAAILLPLLIRRETVASAPREIPVELVRAVPSPAQKVVPPSPSQPAETKPASPKQEAKDRPKPKETENTKPEEPPKTPTSPKPPTEPKTAPDNKAAPQPKSTAERMRELLHEDVPSIDGALALPSASGDGTETVAYDRLVMSQIAKALNRDPRHGMPGARVLVAFTLSDTGAVADVTIKMPSGDPGLDKEAVAMVGRGAPYPVPPPGARHEFEFGIESRPVR